MKRRRPITDDRGFALVAVLFFLIVLAAVLTPFTIAARTYQLVVRNTLAASASTAALSSILQTGALVFTLGEANGLRWPDPTLVCEIRLGPDSRVILRYVNHAGLIDLNAAPPELLAFGFRALGLDPDAADGVAAAVVAFRTADTGSGHAMLAESVAVAGGLKRGPFEAVAELSDFQPLAATANRRLEEVFTVLSGAGTVDRLRLTPVLEAMLRRGAGDAHAFLIESGGRAPAVTLEAELYRGDAVTHRGRTVFAQSGAGETAPLHLLEPMSFEASPDTAILRPQGSGDPLCAGYFEPATQQLLAEFLP
ncbi:hypothetical protein DFR52_102170 [Hoeflea marina]|uniref:General secretion pathway protein K n=1 Tax=Hoeflea marina TaxID=274592 RepID=A0A317PN75_9HYPH|nr:hypothetical protein [Hoeflea marina]PWW01508.1 hypothetical protein DFR52_102170 [Hoeflea marina]